MEKILINGTTVEYEYNVYMLEKGENDSLKPVSKNNNLCSKFSKPESSKTPKIYIVVSLENSIYYIGKTTQGISARLRQGKKPQGNNGYHGYKWKDIEIFNLHCITLPSSSELELESIEAEMVYHHRYLTGCWPLFQTEIHFHNDENIKKLAKELYKMLDSKTTEGHCTKANSMPPEKGEQNGKR